MLSQHCFHSRVSSLHTWELFAREVAINKGKIMDAVKLIRHANKRGYGTPSTPLQKTWVPVLIAVPVFKMWFISSREENLLPLQENILGWKQPFQLPGSCPSQGLPSSPSHLHTGTELCLTEPWVCRPSEGVALKKTILTYFLKETDSNLKKKKTSERSHA